MNKDKLLPCPFCGDEAAESQGHMADGSPWHEMIPEEIEEVCDAAVAILTESQVAAGEEWVKNFIDAVEKLAFEMPPPNAYTPRLVQMCGEARQRAQRPESSGDDDSPSVIGVGPPHPMPTAEDRIAWHVMQIQFIADACGLDPAQWLNDETAQ